VTAGDQDQSPLEQLVELLVYAPVGLLYEYDEVLPKLIRRGKSQVALARFVGQMVVRRGSEGAEAVLGDAVDLVARAVTEFGAVVGLAPERVEPADGTDDRADRHHASSLGADSPAGGGAEEAGPDGGGDPANSGQGAPDDSDAHDESVGEEALSDDTPSDDLPIVGYDELTARVIVSLLDDLTPTQRERIRQHEQANRARKTVLAKLERLERA
jgi:hypothetical protein